ncbi:MAG: D-glycerate dehydrogenase [Acidobacteriota bacterium]|nr:D-glycerate dehydrogenase [Acidobacteriota bacterium]
MLKPNVFATRPLPESVSQFLAPHCDVIQAREDSAIPPAELARICREEAIEGLLLAGARISSEFIPQMKNLRVIANMGKGVDNIDLAACTSHGILVTNTAGAPEESTADLAFGLLLAGARRLIEVDRFVREGRWKTWQWGMFWGANVHEKTIGLLGFGAIGQAMARRAGGFSMRILYHQRRRAAEAIERELKAEYTDPEALIRESDFLSLHVPLIAETRHLISSRELAWMKPTAFLINTSRGPVVDEDALVLALKERRIAGAALDVFEHEPSVHPELIRLSNTVLAPHLGSATRETRTRMAMQAAENLIAALEGRRPPDLLNPEVLETRGQMASSKGS